MKKTFLPLFIVLFSTNLHAQKVKIDSGKIYVDGNVFALMEKDGCKAFSITCLYTIKNLNDKPALVIKFNIEKIESEISAANVKGEVSYAEFIFLQSKQKGQIARLRMKEEKVCEQVVKAKLFKNGELDEEAVSNFVLVNPVVYGLPKQEIIIKQGSNSTSHSSGRGVNIRF